MSNMGHVKSTMKVLSGSESPDFELLDPFEEDSNNGLYLQNIYVPEEVLENILCHVPPNHLLNLTLVCKKWCNIIKSDNFWKNVFNLYCSKKIQLLPWYVYYSYLNTSNFKNLVKNGNGQDKLKYWRIIKNYGDGFVIEDNPQGSDPLPENVPEFYGHKSCFATSFYECHKVQEISLENKHLLRYILRKFHVPIYASEWTAGRFDCGCIYHLKLAGYIDTHTFHKDLDLSDDEIVEKTGPYFEESKTVNFSQWEGKKWEKVEIVISEEYPSDLGILIFYHQGRDTQYWKGHYGSKMAGGVVKFLIEGIRPREDSSTFSLSQYKLKD